MTSTTEFDWIGAWACFQYLLCSAKYVVLCDYTTFFALLHFHHHDFHCFACFKIFKPKNTYKRETKKKVSTGIYFMYSYSILTYFGFMLLLFSTTYFPMNFLSCLFVILFFQCISILLGTRSKNNYSSAKLVTWNVLIANFVIQLKLNFFFIQCLCFSVLILNLASDVGESILDKPRFRVHNVYKMENESRRTRRQLWKFKKQHCTGALNLLIFNLKFINK